MPRHPISGPDPFQPVGSPTNTIRAQRDDASFETDFADLVARFTAQSGGGLSAELSAELALEIVLNEIVEQACVATGATGAAIVLERDGEMVCRASSGSTAPDLGSRLDTTSGLTGECARTLHAQRCDDALADSRADLEASARLGVRSVLVVPLVRDGALMGFFELFSAQPNAFGEREEKVVEALAGRALGNLACAHERLEKSQPPLPVAEPFDGIPRDAGHAEAQVSEPRSQSEWMTWILGVAVVICAMLLGLLLAPHFGLRKQMAKTRLATPAIQPVVETGNAKIDTSQAPKNVSVIVPQPKAGKADSRQPSVPPGGLLVFKNGIEIFRLEASHRAESGDEGSVPEQAASIDREQTINLSPSEAEGSLLSRIEPKYPDEARSRHIQGAVVLDVQIGADGKVQDVQVVSGDPRLARASTDAVKQWRFKTHRVNGRPAEMQTQVTLNFRLPSGSNSP